MRSLAKRPIQFLFCLVPLLLFVACGGGGESTDTCAYAPGACDQDQDGYTPNDGDCDDFSADLNPARLEVCDGVDNNCSGTADEGMTLTFYADADTDGYGTPASSTQACTQPAGMVTNNLDCNDTSALANPAASEICNSQDDNCNGTADEGLATSLYYPDQDYDGYGNSASASIQACAAPSGYAAQAGDCNDANSSANPSATEICDGLDNNCDAQIDEGVTVLYFIDLDGDAYGNSLDSITSCIQPGGYVLQGGDCDDNDATVYPAATEICDGKDNNCNGKVDENLNATTYYKDGDADTYGLSSQTKISCIPLQGYATRGGDCDDTNGTVNPGATEACNSRDDDCDSQIDESGGTVSYYTDSDLDGYGATTASPIKFCTKPTGYSETNDDCNDLSPSVHPGASEACDGLDNDCDTQVDEGFTLTTFYVDADGDTYGGSSTVQACSKPPGASTNSSDCNDASAESYPGALEICDKLDNDCDTQVDEGIDCSDVDQDGYTEEEGDCDNNDSKIYPGATERYNGKDDDCDGRVDESISLSTSPVSYYGDLVESQSGATVAALGDIDGNGKDDFAVGAPNRNNQTGAAFVIMGKSSGWSSSTSLGATIVLTGAGGGGQAGFAVSTAGDLNADGFSDFAVGEPFALATKPPNYADAGHLYLFYGGPEGIVSGTLSDLSGCETEGSASDVWLGYSLAGGGDFNGDGYDDLALGGPWPVGTNNGYLMVLPGMSAQHERFISSTELFKVSGGAGDSIGTAMAYVGMGDYDGIDDLILAGFGNTSTPPPGYTHPGVVYFMTGASDYTTSDTYLVSNRSAASWRGEADNEEVGYSVAGVGDFNGDGFGDFAIARKSQTSSNQAIAYLFFGGNFPTGDSDISSVAPVSFSGESLNCPCTVASAGDMNGDDLGDFVIGVSKSDLGGTDSGAVYLFLGREEPAYGAVSLNDADGVFIGSAGELAGSGLAGLGDINGDGYSDLGIGAPMADNGGSTNVGRTYVLFGLAR